MESVSRPGQLTGYNANVSEAREDWPGRWTVYFTAIRKGLWDSICFGLGVDVVEGPEDRNTIARQHSVRAGKPPFSPPKRGCQGPGRCCRWEL